ncbi:MAG: 16S rRNA (adenine(1518)-N(6)/adenine(1519)-N(6))-dimethyltransferase RsmA [Thermomicrobiaceae bacterium]
MTSSTGGPNDPSLEPTWREILRELEVTPSKALGQNFLHDRKIVRRIVSVADIDDSVDVLEIGPGLGILTQELVNHAGSVTAVELDSKLAARLGDYFKDRARIFEGDILQVNLPDVLPSTPYIVVANLPYSVATAAVQRMFEAETPPERMVIMVQREVAERMVARPPEMSILAVAVQFYATAKIQFRIGSGAFIPAPRVESSVIRLDLHAEPPLPRATHPDFFRLVKAGFSQRRKRLDNSIASSLRVAKADVSEALVLGGLDPSRRAETFDVSEWVQLFHHSGEILGD